MVHALNEIWRVVKADGYLIDLRPHSEKPPVEIVTDRAVLTAGYVDETDGLPKRIAANAALADRVAAGRFALEANNSFELFTYWESGVDFKTYMDGRETATLPTETWANIAQILHKAPPAARLRTRLQMVIARYRKLT